MGMGVDPLRSKLLLAREQNEPKTPSKQLLIQYLLIPQIITQPSLARMSISSFFTGTTYVCAVATTNLKARSRPSGAQTIPGKPSYLNRSHVATVIFKLSPIMLVVNNFKREGE
ncbi:hypothetical protein K443DRAFT_13687 [Laccaria amethystina LaAM-08-1]|uniref:Uncharacterized protein n=1 Tax=Laccaria amethystina LaAM-08-1 TaxID=1095629 RepID=A0A0C9WI52_9AGAR|nr:hypothetical protein K443DRAFT_13687 [Laccaria amethystina LaAM-08-1]